MSSRREFLNAAGRAALTVGASRVLPLTAAPSQTFDGVRAGDARSVDGIEFRWCPPGRFVMGSPSTETGHRPDEAQVEVTLTRGFWTAKFEATQGDWRRIVGAFPDRPPSPQFGESDNVPVYWVNFDEAQRFCARATERARRSGALPAGWEFRLPTEAQWEYACRAGTTTATSFGDAFGLDDANMNGDPLNGGRGGTAVLRAAPVGSYPANPWGICDMHGNIFEWCRDWYHAQLPGGADPDLYDVVGVRNRDGSYSRVRRGGAWNDPGQFCRSAFRLRYEPERRSDHIGFRAVLVRAIG